MAKSPQKIKDGGNRIRSKPLRHIELLFQLILIFTNPCSIYIREPFDASLQVLAFLA